MIIKIDSQQEELGLLRQRPKESGLGAIRKELEEKNEEIEGLIVEIESQKRRDRTKSVYQGKDDSVGLKRKLG